MAGLFSKVSAYARSPEGQRLIKQVQKAAQDPANRAKVQEMAVRLKTSAAAAARGVRSSPDSGSSDSGSPDSGPQSGHPESEPRTPPAEG